jgi:hypothetical protein
VILTPFRAPRANAFAERWVRTVRSECLDWTLVVGRRHLERVLRIYVEHYNRARPHRGLELATPQPRQPPECGEVRSTQVRRRDVLGGLITNRSGRLEEPSFGTPHLALLRFRRDSATGRKTTRSVERHRSTNPQLAVNDSRSTAGNRIPLNRPYKAEVGGSKPPAPTGETAGQVTNWTLDVEEFGSRSRLHPVPRTVGRRCLGVPPAPRRGRGIGARTDSGLW